MDRISSARDRVSLGLVLPLAILAAPGALAGPWQAEPSLYVGGTFTDCIARQPDGSLDLIDKPENSSYRDCTLFSGGGGLVSTAGDYFLLAIRKSSTRPFRETVPVCSVAA